MNSPTEAQRGAAQQVIIGAIQSKILELRREANELEASLTVMLAPAIVEENLPPPPAPPSVPGLELTKELAVKKPNGATAQAAARTN